jgi:hypothetical protein
MTELERFVHHLDSWAAARGGALASLDPAKVRDRLHESDAALFNRGMRDGLLRVDERGYLFSSDPHQATAWMVEGGAAAWPCWEYLPHAASYVELIVGLGFPETSVRFETPEREHGLDLDLAVVAADGKVLVVGEAKKTTRELDQLLAAMARHFVADPGRPVGVSGMAKAAWKLSYRLWVTRAPWLWLVGPSERRALSVTYQPSLVLTPCAALPTPETLGLATGDSHPLLRLPAATPLTLVRSP